MFVIEVEQGVGMNAEKFRKVMHISSLNGGLKAVWDILYDIPESVLIEIIGGADLYALESILDRCNRTISTWLYNVQNESSKEVER